MSFVWKSSPNKNTVGIEEFLGENIVFIKEFPGESICGGKGDANDFSLRKSRKKDGD